MLIEAMRGRKHERAATERILGTARKDGEGMKYRILQILFSIIFAADLCITAYFAFVNPIKHNLSDASLTLAYFAFIIGFGVGLIFLLLMLLMDELALSEVGE